MKILFIGCVKSSYYLLEELLDANKNICGVITKKKSAYNSDFMDLTHLCKEHGIDLHYSDNINDKETEMFIDSIIPDIIYCFGWSELLEVKIIRLTEFGVVGFHPAMLPYNKGRHPIIWALVLGLYETASSFFMIDEKADNGPIISQVKISISVEDDAESLYNKILECAKKQVVEITEQFENNTIKYNDQPQDVGNIWRKRTKADGKIDFRMSAKNIYDLIRGLAKPYVGAHFEFKGKEFKVWKSEMIEGEIKDYQNIEYGKVLEVFSKYSFLVKAGDGLIKIIDCDEIDLCEGDYL